MRFQLRLLDLVAISQPVIIQLQLALVGKILVVMTDSSAHTAQHDCAGGRKCNFQKNVRTIVREVKAAAGVHIMRAKIHPPLIDDEQELQCVDQAGLASVVGCDHRHSRIQGQFGASIAGAIEQSQALESILDHSSSSFSDNSGKPLSNSRVWANSSNRSR